MLETCVGSGKSLRESIPSKDVLLSSVIVEDDHWLPAVRGFAFGLLLLEALCSVVS